ncbi:DUF4625 domain-containing protein [Pontibacter sp. G13]|uniref:DUF4625 domain-containing protein n=1 Tax=Pontibacter sp. G13 TaxID=3074898 RepID=UPI00288A1D48|nr:DUF4625 domain-containing protein [Pontibacter sp. G13]WNJ17170.1 DUF4625 domain-containing protein [Pontibacter sp. G13]
MNLSILKTSLGFGLIASLLLVSACKEDVDTAAPEMEIISSTPALKSGMICGEISDQVFELRSSESFTLDVVFRDNEELSQYKIDIHNNFDCHGHARNTDDWTVLEVVDISGTEVSSTLEIPVPDDVTAGTYHFQVQVVDEAGNDDPFAQIFDLRVWNSTDTIAPTISLTAPAGEIGSVAKGGSIPFEGSVIDNYSLGEGGNGRLVLTAQESSSTNIREVEMINFSEAIGDRATFDFEAEIPQTWSAGTYDFVLSAYDGVNNESERIRWTVEITD